jgi:hypothetical protein
MVDRITLTVPLYMPLEGQWVVVQGGSQLDVASASAFAPSTITNVQLGTGSLLNGQHNRGVTNVSRK